jgi:hypothetical protein
VMFVTMLIISTSVLLLTPGREQQFLPGVN